MSQQIIELEALLQLQIAEHRKLLALLDTHQKAMKKLDVKAMEDSGQLLEANRLRLSVLETRRRTHVAVIAKTIKQPATITISQLAELFPAHRLSLLKARTELRQVATDIRNRNYISSRVAGAMLGHMNTVVRLIAGVVEKAGLYTKNGTPRVSARIGAMEAVG